MATPKSTPIQRLESERVKLLNKLTELDAHIRETRKAEQQKSREAAQRQALAMLHKSGLLDDPARLAEVLSKVAPASQKG